MAKVHRWNNTLAGPYPGRTWEQEAEALERKRGHELLFAYGVPAKIDPGKCDRCLKPNSPDHTYCSRACFKAAEREARQEAEWEARVS